MSVFISREVAKAKDEFRDRLVEAFVSSAIFGTSREVIRKSVGNALDELVQAVLKQARNDKKDRNESKPSPQTHQVAV